jgi:hypothetical protein
MYAQEFKHHFINHWYVMTTALDDLLATHADVLQPLLGPLWPVRPFDVKQYGPLTKYSLGQVDGEWLHLHHVTEVDQGAPHCHPCRMFSTRIKGRYWERIYVDGLVQEVLREEGTSHLIEPECIHLLTGLPDGEVWTLVRTGPVVREWQHYPELLNVA